MSSQKNRILGINRPERVIRMSRGHPTNRKIFRSSKRSILCRFPWTFNYLKQIWTTSGRYEWFQWLHVTQLSRVSYFTLVLGNQCNQNDKSYFSKRTNCALKVKRWIILNRAKIFERLCNMNHGMHNRCHRFNLKKLTLRKMRLFDLSNYLWHKS
jgi:hypothetical protein